MNSLSDRQQHIEHFYALLDALETKVSGKRLLKTSHGRMIWPRRGIYFFFEPGEYRASSSDHLRIVRIGTHAVSQGSKTTLWERLRQHGGGNHRGSIFRRHVGTALLQKDGFVNTAWGDKSLSSKERKLLTQDLETRVSHVLGEMPFLWLEVDDEPGTQSHRSFIEKNSIILLAGANGQTPVDPSSKQWLGCFHPDSRIQKSGLWNHNYIGTPAEPLVYDPSFLNIMEKTIDQMT